MKIILLLVLVLCWDPAFGKRNKRYRLNPEKAEEQISRIPIRSPLYNEQWGTIIGGGASDSSRAPASTSAGVGNYRVKKRDTLWSISRALAQDPKYWPKIWEANPTITNPHEIDSGTLVNLYQNRVENVIRIPLVKLSKEKVTDLEKATVNNVTVKNKLVPRWLLIDEEEYVGEIIGGYTEKEGFRLPDQIYIDFYEDVRADISKNYTIVREEEDVKSASDDEMPSQGTIAKVIGELKIIAMGERLYRAEIVRQYDAIKRGDKLIQQVKPIETQAYVRPPIDFEAKVIMGDETERKTFGQGDLILLNKGSQEGMRLGYLFRVYQDEDPFTKSTDTVEPFFKGEVQVNYVGKYSSLAMINRNTEPIAIGDRLVAAQKFNVPLPSKPQRRDPIEIP